MQKDGGEWVAAYGSPAISRPIPSRTTTIEAGSPTWTATAGGAGRRDGSYSAEPPTSLVASVLEDDTPPADIPPNELPKLAREAAEWDYAAVLERRHLFSRRLLASVCFTLLMGAVVAGAWFVPCMDVSRASGLADYLRRTCFPWGSLVLWLALLLSGFTYVAFWTCGRDNPFQGRSGSYYDVMLAVPVGIILFFLGPVFSIASDTIPDMVGADLTERILGMQVCRWGFGILYNCIFYVIPFVLGLHYSYLDRAKAFARLGTKLSMGYWLHLSWVEIGMLASVVLLLCPFFAFHLWLMYEEDWFRMAFFLIVYGIFVLLLYLISLAGLWHQRFRFSMHHYFVAAVLIPWTGYFNPISTSLQALLAGIFVEGISRWSFIWLFRSIRHERLLMIYLDWVKNDHNDFLNDYDKELTRYEVLGRAF